MYVIKNKDLYMKLILLPATPPYTGYFGAGVTLELAEKYETEQEAHDEVHWLINEQLDPAKKFEGYSVEKIS